MVKQQGIGTSHAKIILMGEHSVVYGQPAIALPLPNVKLTATIEHMPTSEQLIASRYYNGPLSQLPPAMRGIQKLIGALTQRFAGEKDGWRLTIASELPAERGMGSSAATAIAIVRAFFDYYEKSLDRPTLLRLADIEEEVTHRSPSGLDAATSSSANPLYYVKGQAGQPLEMKLTATMVIADTGIKGATKEAITDVQALIRKDPASANQHIDHLGALVKDVRGFLEHNEVGKLVMALDAAQADLTALGVSNDQLDHLIAVARANGARGAKLTGGGRGGCMFAIMETALGARKLASILKENGAAQTWIQPLDQGGTI